MYAGSVKAIIFDMDGVIVDSEFYQFQAFKFALARVGFNLTEEYFISNMVGRKSHDSVSEILNKENIKESLDELIERKRKKYRELISSNLKAMPGAKKLINQLKNNGFILALASSSATIHIDIVLNGLGIKNQFDVIVSGEQVKIGKPNPDIFLITAKKLNTLPDNCLVIEDTSTGVEAAKAAGMKCIAVPNHFTKKQDFSKADLLVESLEKVNSVTIRKL